MASTSVLGYQARTSPLGLVVLERPDPDVVMLGLRFTPAVSGLWVPEDGDGWGSFIDFATGVFTSFGLTPDNSDRGVEPEQPDPLHLEKAYEARGTPQPDGWRNLYMSVSGLRFRCCGNLFEDGEHTPYCPA